MSTSSSLRGAGSFGSRSAVPTRPLPAFPIISFTFALVAAMSRGAIELAVGKNTAYAVQVAMLGIFILVLFARGRPVAKQHIGASILILLGFVTVALLSLLATSSITGSESGLIYVAVMVFFASLMVFLTGVGFQFRATWRIAPVVAVVALSSIAFGILEQFGGLRLFPGGDLGTFGTIVRPASMTGSYLHYPIAISLLGFVLLGIYSTRRHWMYLVIGIAALAAGVITYSRSAMVLVLVGLVFGILLARGLVTRVRLILAAVAATAAVMILVPFGDYADRLLSIVDPEGSGNESRRIAWTRVIELWADSPLLIGSHAGEFSNVTSNFADGDNIGVAESGFLQIGINFGLLGALGFYILMTIAIRNAPRQPQWFRAGMIAAAVQSLFYQSVEVFPFMVIFALTPFIANQIAGSVLAPAGPNAPDTSPVTTTPPTGGALRRDTGRPRAARSSR